MKLQEIVVSNTTSDIGEEADTNNSIGNSEEKIQHSRNITERSKEKCIILAINYIHRKMQKSKKNGANECELKGFIKCIKDLDLHVLCCITLKQLIAQQGYDCWKIYEFSAHQKS